MCCWSTAPTALSDASVMRQVGASGWGYERRVALASASFVASKADRAESVQVRDCVFGCEEARSTCRGCVSEAQWGMNLW